MPKASNHIPVLIAGGGPVGLFLAICLLRHGIGCKILEKRKHPVPDSRSLGIHPVSLELFDKTGIIESFLEEGLIIRKGLALTEHEKLGEISFEHCPEPYNYILMCPQFTTEQILRNELNKLDEDVLLTGAEFQDYSENEHQVEVQFLHGRNTHTISADLLVGCDGKNSLVRQKASIPFSGKRYPDTYIMGDFEDTTDFGSIAAVYLPKGGMIECFPMPNGMRRWVVKTEEYISKPNQTKLAELVQKRIGVDLSNVKSTMLSGFGVQHFMADTFAKGRVLLAGDAAHVVSPIGGQGMNLGWMGAWEIANRLKSLLQSQKIIASDLLNDYSNRHQKIVHKAKRRAEMNMIIGRKRTWVFLRNLIVRGMLRPPFHNKVAELFTMRGLDNGWI